MGVSVKNCAKRQRRRCGTRAVKSDGTIGAIGANGAERGAEQLTRVLGGSAFSRCCDSRGSIFRATHTSLSLHDIALASIKSLRLFPLALPYVDTFYFINIICLYSTKRADANYDFCKITVAGS